MSATKPRKTLTFTAKPIISLGVTATLFVAATVAAVPALAAPNATEGAASGVGQYPLLPDAAKPVPAADLAAELPAGTAIWQFPEVSVPPSNLAAVTWDTPGAMDGWAVWVRESTGNGWSQWYDLAIEDEQAIGAGESEYVSGRGGTAPLLLADATDIQVRVAGEIPAGLTLVTVAATAPTPNPSARALSGAAPSADAPAQQPAISGATQPEIYLRTQWAAKPFRGTIQYGTVLGAFVHHTATANNYTADQVPAQLRSMQTYHQDGRGWADLGYNFVIDRFGRIWEGRQGGIDRAAQGAHTADFNSRSFGVSVLGTFVSDEPPAAVIDSLVHLIAWKFAIHGVADPHAQVPYPARRLGAISGHGDAAATACPGAKVAAKLPLVRDRVATQLADWVKPAKPLPPQLLVGGSFSGPGSVDLVARTADGWLWLMPGDGAGGFKKPVALSGGWHDVDHIVSLGDLTGDGRDDLLTRDTAGRLWLYPGNGRGGFDDRHPVGHGWSAITAMIGVGDMTGDGIADLVARRRDGTLWLYPGNGRGWFAAAQPIGKGWAGVELIVGPGDFDGDGNVDLIAKNPDGRLWLYPGNGRGWFDARRPIGHGWAGISVIAASPDWNGDRVPDVLALYPDNSMYLFPGNGRGWFDARVLVDVPWL